MLIAGRDTIAALFSWMFLLLARHRDVYSKLRQGILKQFGDVEVRPAEVNFAQLKSYSYLQHVIHETLRLYPSVPFNAHLRMEDTVLPTGGGTERRLPIALMKGHRVLYSVYAMQPRPGILGQDAAEFKPERWGNIRPPPLAFLPFSEGPRICLGREWGFHRARRLVCTDTDCDLIEEFALT